MESFGSLVPKLHFYFLLYIFISYSFIMSDVNNSNFMSSIMLVTLSCLVKVKL